MNNIRSAVHPPSRRGIGGERLGRRRTRALHALIGGEDRVAYGAQLPEGESWKRRMLAELDLDLSRLHFTGLLSRPDMVTVMRASDAHVDPTVPFVLSWSLLDAMACGCLLVASDTAPVHEFLEDGVTGLLVPPHEPAALAARIETALDGGDVLRRMRERARAKIVGGFDAQAGDLAEEARLARSSRLSRRSRSRPREARRAPPLTSPGRRAPSRSGTRVRGHASGSTIGIDEAECPRPSRCMNWK